jgi:hypothetical protein
MGIVGAFGMTKIFSAVALGLVAVLGMISGVQAQTAGATTLAQAPPAATLPDGLATAIAAGDTATIDAIVVANAGNSTLLAQIAQAILDGAKAAQATNPTQAALLAALAIRTGALSDGASQNALNIVGSNPVALALLTNQNGPKTGGTFTADNAGVAGQQNPANNSAQNCGSCN